MTGSRALDAPCLSAEARSVQMSAEVLVYLADIGDRWEGLPTAGVVIPLSLCRKASMAVRLLAGEQS